jgi:hypothetical protein
MYTGTLINDLMAAVAQVEQRVRRQEEFETMELRMLASMYAQPTQSEPTYAGAA